MAKAITIDNLTFTGAAVLHGWMFSELTGWSGQTSNKVPVVERPQGHGAFKRDRATRSSRAITASVGFLGRTVAETQEALEVLSALGAEGPVVMSVTDDLGTTFRTVSVETVDPDDPHERTLVEAEVHMIAEDPRRYMAGDWVQTGPPSDGLGLVWPVVWPAVWPGGGSAGRVVLPNAGRAPSAPVFRLYGPFPSATVTCVENGRRYRFDRPVPAGSVVEISATVAGTRRAVLDGQSDVSRWLKLREWVDVPGLSSRSFQFDTSDPAALMMAKVDSAWW